MGRDVEVIVYIDRDLGLAVTKTLWSGATVLDLKEQLAQDDPTGRARAADFVLVEATLDLAGAAVPLENAARITEQLREVAVHEAAAPAEPAASEEAAGGWPQAETAAQWAEADASAQWWAADEGAQWAEAHGGAQWAEAQAGAQWLEHGQATQWVDGPAAEEAQLEAVQAVWRVVGGGDRGGILVRMGPQTSSTQLPQRLSTGSFVAELALEGERLQYRLLAGTGPGAGWVSIRLKDKVLLSKTDRRPAEFPTDAAHPTSPEPQGPPSDKPGGGAQQPRRDSAKLPSSKVGGKKGEPNPYELLGIPRNATEAVINSAFRKVSLKVHPDHCPDDPEAPERFRELTEAKRLLLDGGRRRAYDLLHPEGQEKAEGAYGVDVFQYGVPQPGPDVMPIMLFRELAFTERFAVSVTDQRTGSPALLPLQLFAAKDGVVRLGLPVVELALMMGADPRALERAATMDAVCQGDEMPQLRENGEDGEELPERSGELHRAIVQIKDLPAALGHASPAWLRKNNSLELSQRVSQRLCEVAMDADHMDDAVLSSALHTAQEQTGGWWSSG